MVGTIISGVVVWMVALIMIGIGENSIFSVIPLCVGILFPIPVMVFCHHKLVKMYFIK